MNDTFTEKAIEEKSDKKSLLWYKTTHRSRY
jgi:hypothetical protein